jgi:serine/threonine-protein kinase RsbT
MPPFVEAVYRELARCLSAPNSLAILAATATATGVRRDRLGARHLTDLLAHVQASFSVFGVPQERRDECIARLREIAGAPAPAPSSGPGTAIRIEQEGDIVRARLAGKLLCRELRFSDGCTAKVIAAISELARNIFKHAGKGTVTVRSVSGEPPGIEVVAADHGPGIADVDALLANEGRSRVGPGAGLRGTRELADSFEIVSRPGGGTTVTLRKTRVC